MSTCDVCHRRRSWGCGHTGSQEWAARRHEATRKHHEGRCWHYRHDDCPATCPLAQTSTPGYAAFVSHTQRTAELAAPTQEGTT